MKDIIVVLDNIRSGYNVGSILRTSEFLGVKKIIGVGITPLPPHKEVVKTSIGAEKNLDIERYFSLKNLIKKLKKESFVVIAIEQSKDSLPYYKFKKRYKKIALILGNEIKGIKKENLKLCDYILEIPRIGKIKESLNVSISLSIVLSYLVFEL
ncbi:MAG: TrmH family RNA methyltransferase [Minisyncoccia bacterium]